LIFEEVLRKKEEKKNKLMMQRLVDHAIGVTKE